MANQNCKHFSKTYFDDDDDDNDNDDDDDDDDCTDNDLSLVLAALGPTRSSARSDVWTRPRT